MTAVDYSVGDGVTAEEQVSLPLPARRPVNPDAVLTRETREWCRVYWGSHGCDLPRGHPGQCVCDCVFDYSGDLDGQLMSREEVYADDWVNVGGPPYYGPSTRFYGEDVAARGLLIIDHEGSGCRDR